MNNITSSTIIKGKVIIRLKDRVCESSEELIFSELFNKILLKCIEKLREKNSVMLKIFPNKEITQEDIQILTKTLNFLTKIEANLIPKLLPESEHLFKHRSKFIDFIEYLYNFWRSYDRFIVCDSEGESFEKRPYRTFNSTIEQLTHVIRSTYRDIQESLEETHPKVYRQVVSGAEVSAIALPVDNNHIRQIDSRLSKILVIRQILIYPPLIIDPPKNTRRGSFQKISINPLNLININKDEWLCFPAKVGKLFIMVYFQQKFYELGFSLCNLFELADGKDLERKPDAIYLYGVPGNSLNSLAEIPTVFFEDKENNMLIAAVPDADEFGYFGYLKKMALTLHNAIIIKQNKMPFHGALVKITLKNGKEKTILTMGDSGAGKSESLEAFREIGNEYLSDMTIIADDMGSIDIDKAGNIIGYGTEIGAFLRLDDLKPGYAYGQLDRAIIMSPNKVNARIIMPVTNFSKIIKGVKIDFILYANNYEEITGALPVIQQFNSPEEAIEVFRKGLVMSKGTTTTTGLVGTYFANIFGPPQYREEHEEIAKKFFNAFFQHGLFVGQLRTQLGVKGKEVDGPMEAAKQLLVLISKDNIEKT